MSAWACPPTSTCPGSSPLSWAGGVHPSHYPPCHTSNAYPRAWCPLPCRPVVGSGPTGGPSCWRLTHGLCPCPPATSARPALTTGPPAAPSASVTSGRGLGWAPTMGSEAPEAEQPPGQAGPRPSCAGSMPGPCSGRPALLVLGQHPSQKAPGPGALDRVLSVTLRECSARTLRARGLAGPYPASPSTSSSSCSVESGGHGASAMGLASGRCGLGVCRAWVLPGARPSPHPHGVSLPPSGCRLRFGLGLGCCFQSVAAREQREPATRKH